MPCCRRTGPPPSSRFATQSAALSAVAPATSRSSMRSRSPRIACAASTCQRRTVMADSGFRYIAKKRRPVEDRRFLAGAGRFVADVDLPGTLHVALVASPYPQARIGRIDGAAALALPGVRAVVTGADLALALEPMMSGLDVPKVLRYPLAHGLARYVGEWVVAVVAESRAL